MSETTLHPSAMSKTEGNIKFALMMVAFFLLAWILQGAQDRQSVAIDQMATNTAAIQTALAQNCASRNATATRFNALIDELVTSVKQGTTLPAKEQADRVNRYLSSKTPILSCPVAK